MEKPTLYWVGGPTASGKSALALQIAAQTGAKIVNADAMQIYRGLPLLTAQPSAEDKATAPHALYEIADPAERFSVGKWLTKTHEILASRETTVLVGGTGLYFKALWEGLSEIPPIPEEIRQETQTLYQDLGEAAFRQKLAEGDAESAARLAPNDKQRLIRSMEVLKATGKAIRTWHDKTNVGKIGILFHVKPILLLPERETLYARCDQRFLTMMEHGALEEVRALGAKNLDPDLPAMKILGVPELAAFLRGETTREDAIALAQQRTRNYAKRQMTWFRNQWKENAAFPLRVLTTPDLPLPL